MLGSNASHLHWQLWPSQGAEHTPRHDIHNATEKTRESVFFIMVRLSEGAWSRPPQHFHFNLGGREERDNAGSGNLTFRQQIPRGASGCGLGTWSSSISECEALHVEPKSMQPSNPKLLDLLAQHEENFTDDTWYMSIVVEWNGMAWPGQSAVSTMGGGQ